MNVLNVVNFGGGSYVLYAEIKEEEGEIEVDPEPYSDNFDRPARLLPVEAKALVAAIDLIGEHIPEGSLTSAREKIVAALGEDPMEQGLQVARAGGDDSDVARLVSEAIVRAQDRRARVLQGERGRALRCAGWSPTRSRTAARAGTSRRSTPSATACATSAWTGSSARRSPRRRSSRGRRSTRRRRSTAGCAPARCRPRAARACGSRPSARAGRARPRRVVEEWSDGAVVVELSFAGVDWLVREILKEAGDAAVLEPEDAREAVRAAVARLREAHAAPAGV